MGLRWLRNIPEDVRALEELLRVTSDAFDPPLEARVDLEAYPEKLLHEGRVLVVDGTLDLEGGVAVYCQPERFSHAFIPYIAVRSVGRGLGSQLLGAACMACKEAGSKGIEAQTASSNLHSRRLFKSCGFREVGLSDNRGGKEQSVLLRRDFDD